MSQSARSPLELKPDLPEGLARFLEKVVQRDRELRYATATEFRDALRALSKKVGE